MVGGSKLALVSCQGSQSFRGRKIINLAEIIVTKAKADTHSRPISEGIIMQPGYRGEDDMQTENHPEEEECLDLVPEGALSPQAAVMTEQDLCPSIQGQPSSLTCSPFQV